jgi:hypothetical protein
MFFYKIISKFSLLPVDVGVVRQQRLPEEGRVGICREVEEVIGFQRM